MPSLKIVVCALLILSAPGGARGAGLPKPPATFAVTMPGVRRPVDFQRSLDAFKETVSRAAASAQPRSTGNRAVLAPFGGSKVRPFKELEAQGLVIVGWERPGSPADIVQAFSKNGESLGAVLETAMERGSLDSTTVQSIPAAAQILGLLNLELAVTTVQIQYFLPAGTRAGEKAGLGAWSGDPVSEQDAPLLMRFRFDWKGSPRELAYLSYKITSDRSPSRDSLPVQDLLNLRPGGFDCGYISADGLILFSGYKGTTSRNASRQFLDSLCGDGLILLDYPQDAAYNSPYFDPMGGFWIMGGRAPLEPWGLALVERIPLEQPVFGYGGLNRGDCAKLYQKPGSPRASDPSGIFDFSRYAPVGPAFQFRMLE